MSKHIHIHVTKDAKTVDAKKEYSVEVEYGDGTGKENSYSSLQEARSAGRREKSSAEAKKHGGASISIYGPNGRGFIEQLEQF